MREKWHHALLEVRNKEVLQDKQAILAAHVQPIRELDHFD